MLYFEDFMEDIEDLPYEFKENLTAIRQLDLQVQNIMDPLDGRISDFFRKCSQNVFSPTQCDLEYEKILKEFDEVESKNVEKMAITNQMKDTFNKMIKKLDTELGKFKLEIEADNPGSAEAIERMVNQQVKSGVSEGIQRFDRKRIKRGRTGYDFGIRPQVNVEKSESFNQNSIANQSVGGSGQNDALMTTAVANGSLSPASSLMGSLNTPHSTRRKFDWRNPGSNPIDKAVKLERRRHKVTPVLSDDSESNLGTNDELGMDETGSSSLFDHNLHTTANSTSSVNDLDILVRKNINNDGMMSSDGGRTPASLTFGMSSYVGDSVLSGGGSSGHMLNTSDNQLGLDVLDNDQNEEPRYCFCNDISYGDMIACDSTHCPREWFHYACVNLSIAPKGSWYCRDCKVKNRQRR